ncbi:low-affinity phosphate transporter pho91 [Anaeramoeba flamelloides]|uniref:Low-affinity phosphate transporter pho91 n=1 Tax=Anaeramoeba flamelloides TaxID=1746091 RepID=A0ABQ8XKP1_9EUKA|nr:low-affinity phosphate transporter pho91 [Anaeramoeba flamelloides]
MNRISNVASAVVTTSILLPIIRNSIPHGDNFQKALLIGNALSNSVAGMNTLIASPQNAIAIKVVKQISKHEMSIGFINWMGFGIPCSIVICTLVYLWILYVFPTKLKEIHLDIEKEPEMTKDQYIIVITTIVTVLLMCVNSSIDKYVGDIGITALIPLVVFFGLGLLETQDLGELSWSVLLLIGGGLVLGDGVELSNLLHIISEAVGDLVASQSMWVICLAFMILAGSIGIAISSTVCAVIILPVIGVVGHKYKHLILLTSLVTSVASGSTTLPISSFPNSVAYAVLDKKGNQYLTVKDYLKSGSVSSFLTLVILVTIGYGINLKMGW